MKKIHYTIGLPRSGSTLLMNIVQQNPTIFTSSTCPTPYLVEGSKQAATNVSECIAMDQDVITKALAGFIREGTNGWFSALTDKPVVISKSRVWDTHLNMLFHIYDKPKFIVCMRDLRDIICSFEKLLHKYPQWTIGAKEDPFHTLTFEKRMEIYCTDTGGNLGRPLYYIKHVFEWMQKRPECFFVARFENFNEDPSRMLKGLYNFLELPYFEHDLNNIKQAEQYEHDTVYRAMVSHKTETKLRYLEPSWPKMMSPEQSQLILQNNQWFYETFYPEIKLR